MVSQITKGFSAFIKSSQTLHDIFLNSMKHFVEKFKKLITSFYQSFQAVIQQYITTLAIINKRMSILFKKQIYINTIFITKNYNYQSIISKIQIQQTMENQNQQRQHIKDSSQPLSTQNELKNNLQNNNIPIIDNQSNLLQSKVIINNSQNISNTFDQIPIGGGSKKFNFSQYPEEGDSFKPPPPKKNIVKKAPKKPIQKNQQLPNNQNNSFNEDAPLPKTTQPLDQLPVGGNSNKQFGAQFDQKPIGKSNFNMSQFPQGGQQPVQQKEYPMNQKLKSKAAKLRLSGMQDLIKLLQQDPQNPDINQVQIKSLVKQTTPANLQKALQVLKLWVQKGKKWGDQQLKNAIEGGMAKVNTKKITIQICDLMYQQNPSNVQTAILLGMKGKIAKNIAYYLTVLIQLLAIYGIKKMKYLKPYIPEVVKLLNDKKDVSIKNQGVNLLKQSYKWLGKDVVSPMLGDLKQALKKQIDTFWDTYDQTAVMKAPKGQQDAAQGDGKKKKKVDAYELSEAVDVFKKFNQKWSEGVINAAKWSQKTKMLQQFVKAASVPKIANTQFRHINQMIKRLINDSNFNVVLWDLKVLAVMSRGLRRNFQYVVKQVFDSVIGKFRDKKTQMIQQTFNTLNDFMYCISIEQVLDDVKQGLQDKAPNMKVNLINWIAKFVQAKAQEKGQLPKPALDAIKQLFPIIQKLLNDGNVEVRDCMARNIFKMKLVIGDQFFSPIQAKMNKNLASKVVDTKPTKGAGKRQKTPQKPKQQLSKSSVSFNKNPKQAQKNSMLKTVGNFKKQESKQQNKKVQQPQLKLQRFQQPTFDQSCQKLLQYGFPEQEIKNIKAPGAKQRTNIIALLKAESYDLLTTFAIMRQLFKDWKQVNLPMNKQLIAFIEEKSNQIDKPQLVIIIPFIIQKIGDTKFSEPLYRALQNICQKIPGIFIVGYFIQKIKALDNKKPKLNADVCACICKIIDIVSISNIPVRQTILFANQCFKIQFTKKGGVDLLKKIYSFVGEQIKIYLQAQTYASMQAQFKKTKMLTQEQKKPKIQFSGQAKKTQKKAVNLLQNKPKVDITQKVQQLLPKMNDNSNWQNRKESAQAMMSLINQNFGKVTINCAGDLLSALKTRINDPNKQLPKIFMQLAAVVFPALNQKDVKIYAKMFIAALADGLSDKMEANKKEAANTLNKIGQVIGKEQLLFNLAPFLQGDKQSRVQIISIMLSNEQYLLKTDLKDFPKGITNCLCDKNKQIRNSAQKLFQKIYQRTGIEVFRNIAKNQRPALTKDLNAIYDKYDSSKKDSASVSQSYISKANSPSKDSKVGIDKRNPPLSQSSAKKRSLSKTHQQQKSSFDIEIQQNNNNHSRVRITQGKVSQQISTLVEGQDYFAPIKYLTSYRVDRQQNQGQFSFEQLTQKQQDNLKQQISLLINQNIVDKIFSFNHKRVSEGLLQIIKLCKDISYQNHIRQVYDLLLKWSLFRLWGGSPALLSIIELFPPILSILQKKKIPLTDFQVDLIIAVIRQYVISSYMNQYKLSDSLHIVMKSLVSLSSGQRVVKKFLKQFSLELTSIHRYLKKEINQYYRDGLSRMIKLHLMEFIGNQDTLQEASKIKQLRTDQQFVQTLYKKFHQTVLNNFGFKNYLQGQLHQQNHNNIPISSHQSATGLPRRQRSLSNQSRKRQKSVERIQQNNAFKRQNNNSRIINQDASINNSVINNNANKMKPNIPNNSNSYQTNKPNIPVNPILQRQQHQIPSQAQQVNTSNASSNFLSHTQTSNVPSKIASDPFSSFPQSRVNNNRYGHYLNNISSHEIDLTVYPAPHPISPLGRNLSRLVPPNDQTIKFFTQLFNQQGQKITTQLSQHAKIIFASILKSVMELLQSRHQHSPQKIVNQLNLLQQCIKCKHVIRYINQQLLYAGINFALRQLVYEDQNKGLIHEDLQNRGIQYKIQNFIKVINGVMLRILENGNPQEVVNTLIMINNEFNKQAEKSTKTIYLIMKCTSRVAQTYTSELKLDGVIDFFVAINQYFAMDPPETSLYQFQLPTREKPKPQQNFLNSIKSIIIELCKILNSDIWELYEKAMQQAKYQDSYIAPFIQSLKVRYIQRNQNSRNQLRQNEQLKKISDLLSKNKTFDTGILHLKKYCQTYQQFSPIQYFTELGYDQKFITMVMNTLEGKQRKTPRKDNKQGSQYAKSKSPIGNPNTLSQQQNIQDKIKKLKQKFQQIQPSQNESLNKKQASSSKNIPTPAAQIKTEKQERAYEIKRRIDEMKSRLNQNFDNKPR